MKKKPAVLISLILIMLLSVTTLFTSVELEAGTGNMSTLGPGYFPLRVSVIILILCALSLIKTLREPDPDGERLKLGNMKMYLLVIAASIAFLLVWHFSGRFFFPAGVLIFALTVVFTPELTRKSLPKILLQRAVYSVVMMLFIYGVFYRLMNVRF